MTPERIKELSNYGGYTVPFIEDNNTWHDKTHGMSIVLRLEFDEYYAEFNEVIGEYFKTLQEAKDWCQSEMDDYINVHGVIETEQ